MGSVIEFKPTSSRRQPLGLQAQAPIHKLDLSSLSLTVLETIAASTLREHHRCPTELIAELLRRADEYEQNARKFRDKVKARDTSAQLNTLLKASMKNPSHMRARIDHMLKKADAPQRKILFLDEDYKSRQSSAAFPEIGRLAAELAIDQRFLNEAKHCDYMNKQLRRMAGDYKEGRLLTETRNGVQVTTYQADDLN